MTGMPEEWRSRTEVESPSAGHVRFPHPAVRFLLVQYEIVQLMDASASQQDRGERNSRDNLVAR